MKFFNATMLVYKMLYRFFQFLFTDPNLTKPILGRWGYHWEINRIVKKYYD